MAQSLPLKRPKGPSSHASDFLSSFEINPCTRDAQDNFHQLRCIPQLGRYTCIDLPDNITDNGFQTLQRLYRPKSWMKTCSDVLSVGNASPVINSSVVVIHRIGHLNVLGCSLIHLNLLEPVGI